VGTHPALDQRRGGEVNLEHKTFAIKELTAEGQIEAVISTFGRDREGDVMTREAFTGSQGKEIVMVWSHDWQQPIGKGVVSVGEGSAVFKGQFWLDTIDGEQAYRKVKNAGPLQEYSIGFQIKDAEKGYQDVEGKQVYTRTIKDIELFEASPVLIGAAYNTGTVAVK
jgi:HK97 family phage prohead protease